MPRIFYQDEEETSTLRTSSEDMSVELLKIRNDINDALKRNTYSKNVQLATFYDRQRLETIDAVLKVLTKIDARLIRLEALLQNKNLLN